MCVVFTRDVICPLILFKIKGMFHHGDDNELSSHRSCFVYVELKKKSTTFFTASFLSVKKSKHWLSRQNSLFFPFITPFYLTGSFVYVTTLVFGIDVKCCCFIQPIVSLLFISEWEEEEEVASINI